MCVLYCVAVIVVLVGAEDEPLLMIDFAARSLSRIATPAALSSAGGSFDLMTVSMCEELVISAHMPVLKRRLWTSWTPMTSVALICASMPGVRFPVAEENIYTFLCICSVFTEPE